MKRGLVYKITEEGLKWLVPKGLRWQIQRACHDDVGHFSVDKTMDKVKADYWFPKVNKFIKKYVQSCLQCAHGKVPSGKRSGYLHPIPKVPTPFHTLHADHLGPFNDSKSKNKYILLIIDSFTKFIVLKAVRNTKSNTTVKVFKEYFALFGVPTRLITDRGSSFTSSTFKNFISEISVKHVLNAVATPRANGQVERYNRSVLDALTTMVQNENEKIWDEKLLRVQWGLNNTINKSTGKTPAQLLFGLRLTGDSESSLKFAVHDDEEVVTPNVAQMREEASDKLTKSQEKQKNRFDLSRCRPRQFKSGQLVRVEREIGEKGKSKKLVRKCLGPYRIITVLPNDRYEVEDTMITRKKGKAIYKGVFPVDKIYPWLAFQAPEDSDTSNNTDVE